MKIGKDEMDRRRPYTGCICGRNHYYQSRQAASAIPAVETAAVERMKPKSVVSATGTIRPVDSVEVSSKITALIKSVPAKENDARAERP